jgi:1,4-dihydroxy-2-naphthoate octaprenyltransferase
LRSVAEGPAAAAGRSAAGAWLLAARPKTLVASLVPVLVGTALAASRQSIAWLPAAAALGAALLIQIGTNLSNDYFDFQKGADREDRVGPTRATQSGLIAPRDVLRGAILSFGAAALAGLYLTWVGGIPILVLGVVSILSGLAYTGGPFPLGYHGLGDLFVFLFFGLAAVCGTYYLQAHDVTWLALLAALPVGCLATAILTVNNLRDVATDARAGKRTLAVRLGPTAARGEFLLMLAIAFATPIALLATGQARGWILLPLAALPLAIAPTRRVLGSSGAVLNRALAETARLQLAFGLLLAAGFTVR